MYQATGVTSSPLLSPVNIDILIGMGSLAGPRSFLEQSAVVLVFHCVFFLIPQSHQWSWRLPVGEDLVLSVAFGGTVRWSLQMIG